MVFYTTKPQKDVRNKKLEIGSNFHLPTSDFPPCPSCLRGKLKWDPFFVILSFFYITFQAGLYQNRRQGFDLFNHWIGKASKKRRKTSFAIEMVRIINSEQQQDLRISKNEMRKTVIPSLRSGQALSGVIPDCDHNFAYRDGDIPPTNERKVFLNASLIANWYKIISAVILSEKRSPFFTGSTPARTDFTYLRCPPQRRISSHSE